ncbi:MAG: hypothetical protein ACPG20_04970, partial [Pontimonas sp.]
AQAEATELIAQAHKQAREIVEAAENEATSRVAAAEGRLVELRAERDTIAEYVESLRAIVAGALEAPAPKKSQKSSKRSKPRAVEQQPDSAAS